MMNQARFGTDMPCIGNEVQENASRFGQNHLKSPHSGLIWGPSTPLQF